VTPALPQWERASGPFQASVSSPVEACAIAEGPRHMETP
jgi:hypothetical protein